MRITIFFVFFVINGLVKSQTQIYFFNEFLLGGDKKKYTKIITTNKVAKLSKITVNYKDDKADTVNVEMAEVYKNGVTINYINCFKNGIMASNFKYHGRRFLSGSYNYWIIEEGDTMVNKSLRMFKYKKHQKIEISTRRDYYNEEYREIDSTIYKYKKKNLISEKTYREDSLYKTIEYFNNRNGKLDSVFSKYFPISNNLFIDTVLSKTIYYYDKQLRLIKKIHTKSKSASSSDTDYIFKWVYQYNEEDQIEQIKAFQLSSQQETLKITKIKYLENNRVEIWREKDSMYDYDTKEVYFFSDKLLLLKVMEYAFNKDVWELTSEETYEYTYY